MITIQVIKFILAAVAITIGGVLFRCYNKTKGSPEQKPDSKKAPLEFYSINDANQTDLIYAPAYDKAWFDELDKKYSWDKDYNPYDNLFWEYMYQLFDTLPEIAGKKGSDRTFFNNLTRGQKVFYSLCWYLTGMLTMAESGNSFLIVLNLPLQYWKHWRN